MIDVAAPASWVITSTGIAVTCSAFFIMFRMFVGGNRFQSLQKEANGACALGLFALGHFAKSGILWNDLMLMVGSSIILFVVAFRGTSERRADPNSI